MSTIVLHDEQNLGEWRAYKAAAALDLTIVGMPHAGERRAHEYVGDGLDAHMARVVERVQGAGEPIGIGGSSYGAYASLYVWARNTHPFSRVLAMSPALWVNRDRLFDAVAQADGRGTRVWIDVGGRESDDPARQEKYRRSYEDMRALLDERGCAVGGYLDPDGIHHETAWAQRLPEALRYLYAPADG